MEWWIKFLKTHGERLIFMLLALVLAWMLYGLGMKEEASVVFIGLAMMCYNKARETKIITSDPVHKVKEIKSVKVIK